ncbi:hypothetical protein [Celeribacter baekdonensis]|uniref:hypothetical protein n=1 Tax=Celeribacter baekdonensis TaxID=875171 RepID=UPI003A914943
MTNLTSTRLATIISRSFDFDKGGKTRMHRVIRNFVTKDFVESIIDEHDERGTQLLDLENAAVAVLLLPMADSAVDARGLREVSSQLRTLDSSHGKSPISRLLDAAREGRDAKMVVTAYWLAGTGQIQRTVRIEIDGESLTGDAAQIMADYKKSMPEPRATLEIPTTQLLSTLLAAVE